MIDYAQVQLPTATTPPPTVAITVNRQSKLKKIRERFALLFSQIGEAVGNASHATSSRTKSFFNPKKIGTLLFFIIVGAAIVIGVRASLGRAQNPSGQSLGDATQPEVKNATIDREFQFKVYDKNKELSEEITYGLTEAQLTKQIIIKGQKANAIAGRIFLIMNLKLVNDTDKSLYLNTRNYVRVQPQGSTDLLAPEIHNDTVEVQPLSTKLTRIGLPVDEGVNEFTLFVGELEGEKEEIHVAF